MINFFEFFNNKLAREHNKTYGDLLNNNLKEKIQRSMTPEEKEIYEQLSNFDKEKLLEECGNNNQINNKKFGKPKNCQISGIGEVQQIM